jgi:transcriptional regulator with XRE-family HTH domain
MDTHKRQALEAAGFVFGDAEDFLELTAEERCLVDLRVRMAREIRSLRLEQNLTQVELAKKMKTSQPRVNRIEAASSDVSLELLFRTYYILGGTVEVTLSPNHIACSEHFESRAAVDLVGRGSRRARVKANKRIKAK